MLDSEGDPRGQSPSRGRDGLTSGCPPALPPAPPPVRPVPPSPGRPPAPLRSERITVPPRWQHFANNSGFAVGTNIWSLAIISIAYPVYLSALGSETYGLWTLMNVLVNMTQLGLLSLGPAVTKTVAQYQSQRKHQSAVNVQLTGITSLATAGILLSLMAYHWGEAIVKMLPLEGVHAHTALQLLPWIAGQSTIVMMADATIGGVNGLGFTRTAAVLQSSMQTVVVSVSASLLWFGEGIWSLVWGSLAGTLLVISVSIFIFLGKIRRDNPITWTWQTYWNHRHFWELAQTGSILSVSGALGLAINPLNKYVLAASGALSAVAVYEIAITLSFRLRSLLEYPIRLALPDLTREAIEPNSERTGGSEFGAVRRSVDVMTILAVLAGALVFGTLGLTAPFVLEHWLGTVPADLASALRAGLVAAFVSLLGVPSYYGLIAIGKPHLILPATCLQSGASVMIVGSAAAFAPWAITSTSLALISAFAMLLGAIALRGLLRHAAK